MMAASFCQCIDRYIPFCLQTPLKMISVIIPALNEEKTIRHVVHLAKKSPHVSEVIVVDDRSFDNTVEEAQNAGAIVITSTKLGKGSSMKDGVLYAKNSIIVFLDADITTYPQN